VVESHPNLATNARLGWGTRVSTFPTEKTISWQLRPDALRP